MKCDVYWNLHKNIWSLREKGKVVAHMGAVGLRDVTFRVQPAGRARVIREGKKNVHAFAHGTYDHGLVHDVLWAKVAAKGREITYNPYKYETFVYKDDLTPALNCDRIVMIGRQLWEVVDA